MLPLGDRFAARGPSGIVTLKQHHSLCFSVSSSASSFSKTEVIRRRGPWRNLESVEYATLEWVDWFNNRRLLAPIGNIPPVERERAYHTQDETPAMVAGLA